METNGTSDKRTIAVIGAGSFGTAVTWMLTQKGYAVHMWSYMDKEADGINETHHNPSFLSDCDLGDTAAFTDVSATVEGCESAIIVTPSFAVKTAARSLAGAIADNLPVLVLSKGIDVDTGHTLYQAVADELGHIQRVAVLAGPNHAEELVQGSYAGAVVASTGQETAKYFQELLSSNFFRLYTTDDPIGASMCAASKNVIAIACGMARGLGYGDNTVSLLITRGAAEIARLVVACGGKPETVFGLAGIGDLNTTCNSPHSRNGMYGEAFVERGVSVQDYEAERHMVVEGAHAMDALLELAKDKGIELPITEAVDQLLNGDMPIEEAPRCLMQRALKEE